MKKLNGSKIKKIQFHKQIGPKWCDEISVVIDS
jgi:hypothetical protein